MDDSELIDQLSKLGVASLSKFIGKGRIDELYTLGVDISSQSLATFIVNESGIHCLRPKALRLELISTLSQDMLQTYLSPMELSSKNIIKKLSFNWGDNSSTNEFLNLFNLKLIVEGKNENIPAKLELLPKNSLWDFQNQIRLDILEFYDSNENKTMVHMPTGSGKTRTMMSALTDRIRNSKRNLSIIWFAHNDELCSQAHSTFKFIWEQFGTCEINLMKMWGSEKATSCNQDQHNLIITSFQSANALIKSSDSNKFQLFLNIREFTDTIVVDEAHMSTAPTYKRTIDLLSNSKTKIIGLSATPGRHHINSDKSSSVELARFYNKNLIQIKSSKPAIEFLTERKILSKIKTFEINSNSNLKLSKIEAEYLTTNLEFPKSLLKKLGSDQNRTATIVAQAHSLVNDGKQVIIFCPSVESSKNISAILNQKDIKSAAIHGEMPTNKRKSQVAAFQNKTISVLTNYNILTTGFDAPQIDAVIIARPTLSIVLYSQMVGRGLRGEAMGGTNQCILIDIKDNLNNLPDTEKSFQYFINLYK